MVYYYFNIIFLFLCFMQFMGFPNKVMLLGSGSSLLVFIIMKRQYKVSIREFLLFSSMILYAVITKKSMNALISICVLPVLFYALGSNLLHTGLEVEKYWNKILCMIGTLILGFYIHGVLNSIEYYKMGQLIGVRQWNDYWTNIFTPATAHELYFFPIIALAFPIALYLKKYKIVCVTGICALFYAMFFSVISMSRTPIVIFGILFLLEVLLYLILNRGNLKKNNKIKKAVASGIGLALILILFFVIYIKIGNSYILSVLNRSGGLLGNIRFKAQLNVIKNMFKYPFGGCQIDLFGLTFPHNVWLDLIYTAGIIPFFLFLGYTILTVFDLINLVKNENIKPEIKYIITGLYVAFVLYYMVEPALEGNVQNILPWTYLNGIMYALNKGKEIC